MEPEEKKHYSVKTRGIYDGTMYGEAVYLLPVSLGTSLVRQKKAVLASKSETEAAVANAAKPQTDEELDQAKTQAKPSGLTAEQALEKFFAGDFSDETLEGIKANREAIAAIHAESNKQPEGSLNDFAKAEAERANAEIVPNKNDLGGKPEETTGGIAEKLNSERGANEPNALDALPPTTEGGNSTEGENSEQGGNALEETDEEQTDEEETEGGNGGGTSDGIGLPENLPFRRELIAGGVVSMEQLTKMTKAQLIEIKGVKDVAAQRIGAFLAGNE